MADEAPSEPLFRASKRRKVIRKPTSHADLESDRQSTDEVITEPASEATTDDRVTGLVVASRKKGGAGKSGINFSTTDARRTFAADTDHNNEERSLVVVGEGGASQIPGSDRFVKPTGRVGPTEDRHMMAYIGSKLAESRPPAHTPSTRADNEPVEAISTPASGSESTVLPTEASRPANTTARTISHAQERSHRTYQRPTRRKPPPMRKEADVVRDSMIEQIMGENQVPHYEQAGGVMGEDNGDDAEDRDAAAEDAFKARLLADLEQSNRRRRPAGKTSAAGAATGPKLGGSRSQREKMKALEEAKGKK